MGKNTFKIPLLLVGVLALILRLPGVFWGVHWHADPKFLEYELNEPTLTDMAWGFIDGHPNPDDFYPKGFSFQEALCSSIIKPFHPVDDSVLTLVGRMISVLFGVLTVFFLFFWIRKLTSNAELAFVSSLMLSLMGLHVTQSHVGITDVELTFWMYALMYCSLLYIRTDKMRYFIGALFSCGMALSLKLPFVAVIPIVYILVRNQWNWRKIPIVLLGLLAVFVLATGGKYTLCNFFLTWSNVVDDNLQVRHFNHLLNVFCYAVIFIPALGLPIFLLALRGFFSGNPVKIKFEGISFKDILFIVILPLVLQFVSICFIAFPAGRHILPFLPFFAVMAAFGFMSLRHSGFFSGKWRRTIFWLGLLYQLVFVCSNEYYFVFETRDAASSWIRNHIPSGEKIALPYYDFMPSQMSGLENQYKIVSIFSNSYVVLHEEYYSKYTRSILNPFTEFPAWDEVFHGQPNEYKLIQGIFQHKLPYKLVKKFEVKPIIPEMMIYKELYGTFDPYIGDVLIYQKLPR